MVDMNLGSCKGVKERTSRGEDMEHDIGRVVTRSLSNVGEQPLEPKLRGLKLV